MKLGEVWGELRKPVFTHSDPLLLKFVIVMSILVLVPTFCFIWVVMTGLQIMFGKVRK